MHLNVWCGTSHASQSETSPVSLLSSDGMERNDDDNASASRHVGRRADDLIYNVKRTRNTVVYCPLSALVSVRCLATRLSSCTKLCTEYSTACQLRILSNPPRVFSLITFTLDCHAVSLGSITSNVSDEIQPTVAFKMLKVGNSPTSFQLHLSHRSLRPSTTRLLRSKYPPSTSPLRPIIAIRATRGPSDFSSSNNGNGGGSNDYFRGVDPLLAASGADFCPVPEEQQPINEYNSLLETVGFQWVMLGPLGYVLRLTAVGLTVTVLIGWPVASITFNPEVIQSRRLGGRKGRSTG